MTTCHPTQVFFLPAPLIARCIVPMVKGNTILIILVMLIEARSTAQSFLHDRLGTRDGTACKVGIAANRCEMSGSWREIMIRERWNSTCAMSGTVRLAVVVTRVGARMEGRRVGEGTARAWDSVVLTTIRPPVNGLHAVFEVSGRPELPFADEGPDNDGCAYAHGDDNQDGHGSVGKS